MKVLIGIDDTDDPESPGTGELAAGIAAMIEWRAWGQASFITRHQLFVHPDIPYTSHNSAMCFSAEIEPDCREHLIADAGAFLARQSAPGSDPGLCVVTPESLTDLAPLTAFGEEAKRSVLTKQRAYALAHRLHIHLSEHGGSGLGVIGALAGAGLRLGGNDGRMRGTLAFPDKTALLSVKALRGQSGVDAVQALSGEALPDETLVQLGDKVKTVMLGGQSVLLLSPAPSGSDASWRTCTNRELKHY